MINEKRPRVKMVIGNVRTRRINPSVALTNAMSTPAKIAVPKPLTCTPGTIYAPIDTTKPNKSSSIKNLIMVSKFKVLKYVCLACILMLNACRNKDNNKLEIEFSKDSSAVVVSNVAPGGLYFLAERYKSGDSIHVISVLETPSDNDSLSREVEINGRTEIHDNSVWFYPSTPFLKNKEYLVSTVLNMYIGSTNDMLKSAANISGKSQEKRLIR